MKWLVGWNLSQLAQTVRALGKLLEGQGKALEH